MALLFAARIARSQALVEVWRQALVENAKAVKVGGESYPVRRTPKRGLRQMDFVFNGNEIRGLEPNPDTKSRWARIQDSAGTSLVVPWRSHSQATMGEAK